MLQKSNRLATFGFLATIIVVMSHADLVCSKSLAVSFLGDVMVAGHVYNFFFISGFLISRHLDEKGWYGRELAKRVRTLIVPYFIWCAVYGVVKVIVNRDDGMSVNTLFGLTFGMPPYNVSLWYVKCLLTFILVMPVFLPIVDNVLALILLAICSCMLWMAGWIFSPGVMSMVHFGFNLQGLSCFLIGVFCFRKYGFAFFNWIGSGGKRLGSAAIIAWLLSSMCVMLHVPGVLGLLIDWLHAFVCVASLQIVVAGFDLHLPDRLTSTSFFVIASHLMIIRSMGTVLLHFPPCIPPVVAYWIVVTVTLVVCIVGAFLMRKFMRRTYLIVIGGR